MHCLGICAKLPLARLWAVGSFALLLAANTADAQLVPGTGRKVAQVGDDFEDPNWSYKFNLPKGSHENDGQRREPSGISTNGRWFEGMMRGQPDTIKRVATPEGGLPGSTGALLMGSLHTGTPGSFSSSRQQDDLIVSVAPRLGGPVSVGREPNCVVRVYLPEWDQWERRSGTSFGFRAGCSAYKTKKKKGRWGGSSTKLEEYWPGLFIQFNPGDGEKHPDAATLVVRAGPQGQDFAAKRITEPGWWTLGMSFTGDGQIHYYARPGIENLRQQDHISSQYPYGMRCERFDAFFFNVVNGDNGTWSTPWIIDDPEMYLGRG